MQDNNFLITSNLQKAIDDLTQYRLVVIPTETVYGLAGFALCNHSMENIYKLKNRPLNNPLIVHAHSMQQLEPHVNFSPREQLLAQKFWPGPLTLLVKPKQENKLSPYLLKNPRVGVRVPNHPLTLKLLYYSNKILAAPSANFSCYISPTSAHNVTLALNSTYFNRYCKEYGYLTILDGGRCDLGLESSVIEVLEEEERINILRPGFIKAKDLAQVTGFDVRYTNNNLNHSNSNMQHETPRILLSPGQMSKHYAPNNPAFWVKNMQLLQTLNYRESCFLDFNNFFKEGYGKKLSLPQECKNYFSLSCPHFDPQQNLIFAAHHFFDALQNMDKFNCPIYIAPIHLPSHTGYEHIAIALEDRLLRATKTLE